MTRLISIVAVIGIVLATVITAEEEFYSDKYDDIDVNSILENDRLREEYYECFMDRAPCTTASMKFYKVIFGEAVLTKCKKCTEKQKQNLDITVDWYTKNQPDKWNALVEKNIEELKQKNGE